MIKPLLSICVVSTFALAAGYAMLSASAQADTCNLSVKITRDNNPLMAAVSSEITNKGALVATETRHSYNVKLACPAKYEVSAVSGGEKRVRPIHLNTDGSIRLEFDSKQGN